MKRFLAVFAFISFEAYALEAVVTVLETPMFKEKSYDAPVVQYLRKGDVIKIHPSVANDRDMDKYAPEPKKLAELRERLMKSPELTRIRSSKARHRTQLLLKMNLSLPSIVREILSTFYRATFTFISMIAENLNREFRNMIRLIIDLKNLFQKHTR